ncbi:MAG: GerMN domain-containing protein [Bacillota bacterium]
MRVYLTTPDLLYLVPVTLEVSEPQGTPEQIAAKLVTSWDKKTDLKSPFPAGTAVRSVTVKDGVATVDLSRQAATAMGSSQEAKAVESLVRTMTSLPGVAKVRILVEGKQVESLAGHVDISRVLSVPPIINHDGSQPLENTMKVTLWFGYGSYLVPVTRFVPRTVSAIRSVVTELIKGPEGLPGLSRTIPQGTKLLGVNLKEGIAYVDLSQELKTKHWGGSTAERMTVESIALTVTEFPTVSKVQILIAGKRVQSIAGHMSIDAPIARNDPNPLRYADLP